MNVLNLPHLTVVPDDIRERIDRVWISSGRKGIFITKSDEVYAIDIGNTSNPLTWFSNLHKKKVIDIIFGENFTIALNVKGQLYSWGKNGNGQLGLGHTTEIYAPTMISFLSDKKVIKVACGDAAAVALCENGEVFHWGYSTLTSTNIRIPAKCNESNSGVSSIACSSHSMAFTSYGSDDGVLRSNPKNIRTFFNKKGENKIRFPGGYVEFENIIEKVVCGVSHVLVLDSEGKVQIATKSKPTFIPLDISEKIIDIAANSSSTLSAAMSEDKIIFVWNTEEGKPIRPYPTSFVSFQEAFLSLSEPVTSYGVSHLKEINLAKNLNMDVLESIIKIFDEPEHSDFTMVVEDKKIHVHKAILVARSSYFRTMFREQWQESKESQLKIKDFSYEAFKNYLKYLYGMEIEITSGNAIDLMKIADQYMDETLEHLITKEVENDETFSKPIKLLKEMMGLPASDYEVLCKGLSALVFSKDSSSRS